MIIGNKEIKDKAYVIAEIAGNFSNLGEAKKLIDGAVYAGADAVKLQTYKADTLASKKAKYEMENTGNVSQYELFKEGELSEEEHLEIYKYANEKNIDIFSTPSHIDDVKLLEKLGTKVYKIGSDDSYNLPFIEEVAKLHKPIMVATGMRTIYEVDEIVNTIMKTGNKNFMLFHAVTSYPTPYELANLNVIKTMLDRYPNIVIGYSDHTIGWQCSYAARVMGAIVIERHFTLDRNANGSDHILSSTPEELKLLIDAIRIFEQAKGDGIKMPVGQELINRKNNSKSIVLNKNIKKNEIYNWIKNELH
jgi:N,N'-diacetyllegionaminate synthase